MNSWFVTYKYPEKTPNLDTVISDTRIISNQVGYPGENVPGFNGGLVVDV